MQSIMYFVYFESVCSIVNQEKINNILDLDLVLDLFFKET